MKSGLLLCSAIAMLAVASTAGADSMRTATFRPTYLPPAELQAMLGSRVEGGRSVAEWSSDGQSHSVEIRRNDTANLLLFTGASDDVTSIESLAKSCDVAPRQIALEARIVEVNTDKARDLGIDWSQVQLSAGFGQMVERRINDIREQGSYGTVARRARTTDRDVRETTTLTLNNALHFLEQQGAATTRDVPRILTLNNREATIFDGARVTYVNRASGYSNIFATETMDAGLRLEVTPSLVESGSLRLQLHGELTSLVNLSIPGYYGTTRDYAAIAGSPVKQGQIIDNTIVAKDGETIVLGGFTRTVERHVRQRFPILGNILPWIFSREIVEQSHHETIIAITPRVVDMNTAIDDATKSKLDGH